jgi:raffinose/stachyose/melibiose transport system substrate-binding protein
MKQLRRTALAVFAVTTLVLTGCSATNGGNGNGSNSGPVRLNYWTEDDSGPPLANDKKLVADFNAAHPKVQIVLRPISNASFFTVMRNAFTSNNPPEIFQHEGDNNLFQFVKENEVLDISDWWKKPGVSDRFAKGAPWDSVTYEGKVYGVPLTVNTTGMLYYNKPILKKSGIDPAALKTWPDYLAAFAKLKSAGVTPIAYGNSEGWPGSQWFYNFLAKTAGAKKINQLIARHCGYKWTDPDVVQAAQLYTDISKKGYFSPGKASDDTGASGAAFLGGKGAFYYMGNWEVQAIDEAPNAKDFGMNMWPTVPGGKGGPGDQLINAGGLALSKSVNTPAKKKGALEFLDWISQPKQQELSVKAGNISAVTAANVPSLQSPLAHQVVEQQIKPSTGSFPFIEHVTPKAVGEDAIWQGSVAVLTGQATPMSWMQSVEKAAEANKPTSTLKEDCTP